MGPLGRSFPAFAQQSTEATETGAALGALEIRAEDATENFAEAPAPKNRVLLADTFGLDLV